MQDAPGTKRESNDFWNLPLALLEAAAAPVSDVISEAQAGAIPGSDFDFVFSAIAFLEENGFLRSAPATLPYEPPAEAGILDLQSFGIWLHINNDCNLACSYCFVTDKSHTAMSTETINKTASVIANTARMHDIKQISLKFAGGEPTLVLCYKYHARGQNSINLESS